jgi:hypothetical protein
MIQDSESITVEHYSSSKWDSPFSFAVQLNRQDQDRSWLSLSGYRSHWPAIIYGTSAISRLPSSIFADVLINSRSLLNALDEDTPAISTAVWSRSIAMVQKIHLSAFDQADDVIPNLFYGNHGGIDITWENGDGKLILATAESDKDFEWLYKKGTATLESGIGFIPEWEETLITFLRRLRVRS